VTLLNHANNCILASRCKLAGSAQCNKTCGHFIALHGLSSNGGRIGNANAPNDYKLLTLVNSPAREEQAKVYVNIEKYVATFERIFQPESERIKSLYLWSKSPGTGKTTTAIAILNEWIMRYYYEESKRNRQTLTQQTPGYFLDVNQWQTDYNNFNRPKVPDAIAEPAAARYYSAMEKAKHAPLAVLDDVGVRDCTDGFRGDLHTVINYRVTNQLPTIYTSNLPIEFVETEKNKKILAFMPYDLIDVFGEKRLADRISDMCAVLHFGGESKRGRR
jgi:DNA replication protein DnaC